MEIALRRLDGVEKISVCISKQRFQITHRPRANFQAWDIRDDVAKAEVEVLRVQIAGQSRVFEDGGKRFFVAGKDKCLLVASPKIPSAEPVSIEGTVDDSSQPLQLKVLQFKLLKQ